ncbi:hypothetical protein [Methylocaldum sp.]|uniref:hypothetical protein n=1 Tax=Methylocaldum sp. TaxID=1969727 RepID=UPI002D2FDEBA|nr:hypothetical protein [Methylocaldum sp.]HYE38076.1 hypothetical protein [Methylocaldum sp.]
MTLSARNPAGAYRPPRLILRSSCPSLCPAYGAALAPGLEIRLAEGLFTGSIDRHPLREVLSRLSPLVPLQIELPVESSDSLVSAEFSGLPLAELIARLLGDRPYAWIVDPEGEHCLILPAARRSNGPMERAPHHPQTATLSHL